MRTLQICLVATILTSACAENDNENVPAPTPTPLPLVDPSTGQIIVQAAVMSDDAIPDDYGFTATYASFGKDYIRFKEGETVVKIRKNHVQLRNQGDTEILDCLMHPNSLPTMHFTVEGRQERLDTLMGVTCTNMLYLASPIINMDELCEAYECVDEKLRGFDTIKVMMKEPLWVEKESNIRIQSADGLQMISKIPTPPTAADFEYPVLP
jgi:hypothetical protein